MSGEPLAAPPQCRGLTLILLKGHGIQSASGRNHLGEALYIKDLNPQMNRQADDLQALPSARRTRAAHQPSEQAPLPNTLPTNQSRVRTRGLRVTEEE
ncbi:hypothetical protein E2C01_035110 [Portunus trituberculatus]|uniref:Uncharacterized protein n=1 Tax=Portunus trituberculatus TaxID=210409 RepID=A0A5B7F7G2_PORTR|nr:hypothetical protein [Portunus trituberculatus]